MRLTVIGCSGSLPGPAGPASCYLVEADDTCVVLDLGSGALGALQRVIDPLDLDAVLLSHLHPDHCLDLCGLYVLRRYGPVRPSQRLPVHGPTGTDVRMARVYGTTDEPGLTGDFAFIDHTPGPLQIGPLLITTTRVAHPVEAYAIRVEHDGRALVYSGDTGPTDALVEIARGADVLLCEASFGPAEETVPDLHLTGPEAGEHAQRAGVGHLLITHVPPWNYPAVAVEQARTTYAGPVAAAEPGLVLDV